MLPFTSWLEDGEGRMESFRRVCREVMGSDGGNETPGASSMNVGALTDNAEPREAAESQSDVALVHVDSEHGKTTDTDGSMAAASHLDDEAVLHADSKACDNVDKAGVDRAVERIRALQQLLRQDLASTQALKAAQERQRARLEGFVQKSKRTSPVCPHPSSAFSVPGQPQTAPPKNLDAVRRKLFQEVQLEGIRSSLSFRLWSDAEDKALKEALRKVLREERFTELYKERKKKAGAQWGSKEVQELFDDLRETLKEKGPGELLKEQKNKTDWKRVAGELKKKDFHRSPKDCYLRYFHHLDPRLNSDDFDKTDDKALLHLATVHGGFDWDAVAEEMGTGRSAWMCFRRYQGSMNPGILRREWTMEEDRHLLRIMDRHGTTGCWTHIAAQFGGGRHVKQLQERWYTRIAPSLKSGAWSQSERLRLKCAVRVYGRGSWKRAAEHVPGRSACACQHRYENAEHEGLKRVPSSTSENRGRALPWTEEEDKALLRAIDEYGVGNWSVVKLFVAGRSTDEVLSRFRKLKPWVYEQYVRLLATQRKMFPSMVPNVVGSSRSHLKAADFRLPGREAPQQAHPDSETVQQTGGCSTDIASPPQAKRYKASDA